MNKLAVIDIGTNSIRMLGVCVDGSDIQPLVRKIKTARLGHGVDEKGILSIDSIKRAEKILREYMEICRYLEIPRVYAFATSAVRDASNRQYFLERIKNNTGLDIEVLSGQKEARLSFKGAVNFLDINTEGAVVVDIGGGSTEIILGSKGTLEAAESIDIGAVRLTERFLKSDPIKQAEIKDLTNYIAETLSKSVKFLEGIKSKPLIGVGGTITTLAAVNLKLEIYESNKIHGRKLTLQKIRRILEDVYAKNKEERQHVPGLPRDRADIIPAGTQILVNIMEFLNKDSIIVSDYGIMMGYVLELKNKAY